MPNLKQREIDRIYNAIRPRLRLTNAGGGSGGGTGTVPPHTHPASAISFEPAGDIAGDDVQEGMEELAEEKLARSGVQPMLGNLDMNSFDIENVDALYLTGTALIDGAETIQMTGPTSHILDLGFIEFDLAPTHTHVEGGMHWDSGFDLAVTDVLSPVGVQQLPLQATYIKVKNNWGGAISAGWPVNITGYYGSPDFLPAVSAANWTAAGSKDIAGVAVQAMADQAEGWVCTRGLVRVVGGFAGLSGYAYLTDSGPWMDTTPPTDAERGCASTVRVGYALSDDYFIVDIERRPTVQELSDVVSEATAVPVCGDVLVRQLEPTDGNCGQWIPSGLWTEIELDFGVGERTYKVFELPEDNRVKGASDIITMVPSAKAALGRQEDEAEFDTFTCSCIPFYDATAYSGQGGWRVRAYIHSLRGRVVGEYLFNYTVSNPAIYNCVPPPPEA